MQFLMIATVGFLASAALSVLTLHWGAEVVVRVLGKDRCLSTDGVNGCNWWLLSIFVSMILVCGAGAHSRSFIALLFVPTGPVLLLLFLALHLRFAEQAARRRQFQVTDDQVCELKSGRRVHPQILVKNAAYSCTGPASGYCLYSLTIYSKDGSKLTNGYVSGDECARTVLKLTQEVGCFAVDLVFEARENGRFLSVTFGADWTELLCGDLAQISPEVKVWWQQWLQPKFGPIGSQVVAREEILTAIASIEEAYADTLERVERIASDCQGVRKLLGKTSEPIWISTTEARGQVTGGKRGDGYFTCSYQDGVWIEELRQRS